MTTYKLGNLPLENIVELETHSVLKATVAANRYLAELKGISKTIPNEIILINTLVLQEAKGSSEIENIVTTHDALYRARVTPEDLISQQNKEVLGYAQAMQCGFKAVQQKQIIRLKDILLIQQTLEGNNAGLRKQPGTTLKNSKTGEIVYEPPQHFTEVEHLVDNLIQYLNDDELCHADPLIKMAIIHHQFESIHPFYDGNGRTGRIINILYLIAKDMLDLPVLYLSRFMIRDKSEYYRQLQRVRDTGEWEPWIIYILNGISSTAQFTIGLIKQMKLLIAEFKATMRTDHSSIYRQELLNNIFKHPYTKIDFVTEELGVSRITATKYLDELAEGGLLFKEKVGRSNYYINTKLCHLLMTYDDT